MNLPYLARLVCLCLAAFFLIHLLLGMAVLAMAPRAIRFAQRIAPRKGAFLLLFLRLLPVVASLFLVAAVLAPSYFWLEPKAEAEPMGILCLLAVALGISIWAISIVRAGRALVRSSRYAAYCRGTSREVRLPGERTVAWVVDGPPRVMVTGLLRPRLVISSDILAALTHEQLSTVIRHERAHG
jgi:Zn-dependent protease with chaperone function